MKLNRITAALCAAMMVLYTAAPMVSNASTSEYYNQWSSAETMSINVVDADVRDVLSAVAVNLGYSIVYNGDISRITIELENMNPSLAFDYLLKMLGMTYLREGNTLIVGTREVLSGEFARSLSLTKFQLQYVDPGVLTSKIQQLNIPVTVISMAANSNTIWVQGFPGDIGKVRELIAALDVPENVDESGLENAASGAKTLSYIRMSQVSAYEFNRFIKSLGFECGVSVSDDDERLWIYATAEERKAVNDLKSKVDRSKPDIDIYGADMFDVITVKNISKSAAVSAVGQVCPKLKVISVDNASRAFFVNGTMLDIERARDLINELDGVNDNQISTTFFVYNLQNITAAEAARRLGGIQFGDSVTWYTTTHEDFSASVFVYCNKDYQNQIMELLDAIDYQQANAIPGIPVYVGTSEDEAILMQNYLTTMLGDKIIGSFQTFDLGGKIVLYLYGSSPESVKLVEDMIARLSNITIGDATAPNAQDLSYEAFVKAHPGNPEYAEHPELYMDVYGKWVAEQLKKTAGTSVKLPASPVSPLPAQPNVPIAPDDPAVLPTEPDTKGDTDKVNSGMAAITEWFYGEKPGYMTTTDTIEKDIIDQAVLALEAAGLPGVIAEVSPETATVYKAPTVENSGEITVVIKVTSGTISNTTTVYLLIPRTVA